MNINAIYVMWLREMKRYTRNKSRIAGNMAVPFFFLFFLGTGFNSLGIRSLPEGVGYLDFLTPGIIAMALLFGSMFSGISILFDRQFGFLKEIMVSPVDRFSIVLGRITAGITTGIIQSFVILAAGMLMGVSISGAFGILFSLAFMLLIAVSFVGLGIIFASVMDDMHGFQLVMNFLIMPTFLLSGALFPLDRLPQWLSVITYLDPLTYGVDGLRGLVIGTSHLPIIVDFAILGAFAVSMLALATHMFNRAEV